jgi:hypothetical protein
VNARFLWRCNPTNLITSLSEKLTIKFSQLSHLVDIWGEPKRDEIPEEGVVVGPRLIRVG